MVTTVLQPDPVFRASAPIPSCCRLTGKVLSQWQDTASPKVTPPEGVARCQPLADSGIHRSSSLPQRQLGRATPAPELTISAARASVIPTLPVSLSSAQPCCLLFLTPKLLQHPTPGALPANPKTDKLFSKCRTLFLKSY